MTEQYMNCAFFATKPNKASGKKIAIVGAGPAGLASAGYLASAGHSVTVFDKLAVAGGLMTHGIPEWRIPRENIQSGVDVLTEQFGVEFKLRTKILGDSAVTDIGDELIEHTVSLESLRAEFTSIIVATGSWKERPLGIPNEESIGAYNGVDFLYRIRAKQYGSTIECIDVRRKRVIVVGAGFTAIDVAIRAMEHGAESVAIVYRRTSKEAPAGLYEITHATNAGVQWVERHSPVAIVGNTTVEGVQFTNLEEGKDVVIPCDIVIKAIGDTASIPKDSICERIVQAKEQAYEVMKVENLYIAGDALQGASKIGKAVNSGLCVSRTMITALEEGLPSSYFPKQEITL